MAISKHTGERCVSCKDNIKRILEKIYGKVERDYPFDLSTHLEGLKNCPYFNELSIVFEKLKSYRGFDNFIRSERLRSCDYFIPNPGFILEFDEIQHFTILRKISLEHYPLGMKLGFSLDRWKELCIKIHASDPDPPDRDEQRAWYDTLRDFLPSIKNLKPSIRLCARDCRWCELDTNNPLDIDKFKNFL